jgi:phenylalanine-4-hydroxylase
VMRTDYRIDDYQQTYFVIASFDDLLRTTVETDFGPVYAELETLPDYAVDSITDDDEIMTCGTQNYARAKIA